MSACKRTDQRYVPYIEKKNEPKNQASKERLIWPKF